MKTTLLFVLAITIAIVSTAQSAGPNYPGTTSTVALTGSSAVWTNPGNIISDNTTYASAAILKNTYTNYLVGKNYGFSIPAGATILGITVEIENYGDGNRVKDYDLFLTKDGSTPVGTDYSSGTAWGNGTPGIFTYGGAADLWGTTWTVAEINSVNFGVMLSATQTATGTVAGYVDFIRVTVTYSAPLPNECTNALPVTVGTSCSYTTFTNAGATYSSTTPLPGCASYTSPGGDVWYSVVVPACGHLIFDTQTGDITDGGMAIYSGTCGSLTLISCNDDGSTNGMMPMIDATGLTPGSTIYIRFWEYGGDVSGTFGLCVYNPEPNCSGTPAPGATTASPSSGVCSGDAVLLSTAQTSACGLTYQWQSSTNNITYNNISGATSATYTANPTATTWYRLLVTCSYSGLNATSTPVQVVVNTTTSTCANATVISSIPYTSTGRTTCCMGNDYDSGDDCASLYMDGEDFLFKYTPTADIIVDITLSNTSTYTGVFVTDACPSANNSCVSFAESSTGNPQLCGVLLEAGTTYYIMVDTYPGPECTNFDINITTSSAPTCGLNYTISTIAYSPITINSPYITHAISVDDTYDDVYTDIGFNFCYDGIGYSRCLISSNGYIIFDPISCATNHPSGNATLGGSSPWSIDYLVPNTNDAPRNCIMFPWMDTDPNNSGTITSKITGTSPNRIFIVDYDNVEFFSTSCAGKYMDAQVKLFETSNNIEIHIGRKDTCFYWQEAAAVLGLHNYNGTDAVIPSGYNFGDVWTATNKAWRFTCNCTGCITLPVEYLSFEGEVISEHVNRLEWVTATEVDNHHFEIQRKNDDGIFESIFIVAGAGNSNEPLSYSYTDNEAPSGVAYYRLKQVDNNGKETVSHVIAVGDLPDAAEFISVFPNPASDELTIKFSSDGNPIRLVLVAAGGQEIVLDEKIELTGMAERKYNITAVPAGVYMLKADNRKSEYYFKEKIVVQ